MVEVWSPKPKVVGSNPAVLAILKMKIIMKYE
jgi:hypothetical protein